MFIFSNTHFQTETVPRDDKNFHENINGTMFLINTKEVLLVNANCLLMLIRVNNTTNICKSEYKFL